MKIREIKERLVAKGLKVTPQRLAILEAIYALNHPSVEMIMEHIKDSQPGISRATIYKVLDALEENQLVCTVKTGKDIKRYEGFLHQHHHLYSNESQRIEDYENHELDRLIAEFFKRNKINGFEVEQIRLQINGKFTDTGKHQKT